MDFNNQQFNHSASPDPVSNLYASSKIAQKRRIGWLWIILAILAIIIAAVFISAVYAEISNRDAELKNFLKTAQKETSGAIIENELLSGLSGKINSTSSTADSSVSSTALIDVAGSKDKNRQLAEKSGRPQLGNTSSSLVIVEFADFQCPTCLAEFPIFRAITNKYAKDVLFIFRNYPVIDQNSMMFAEAGLCALEQGKFWPLHDRLYPMQGQISKLDDFKQIALMSGLNWNKLQDCVNKEKYKPQLLEDMSDALDLGVRGTPTFFVNGKKLEGAVTQETWEQIIVKFKELNK
ncbi:MAG: thioredoxin domain-containing protein [Candidatus Buchananbacteria bacterium]|jgi:protein-disulfide isomerase